jgi:hypothetical protein
MQVLFAYMAGVQSLGFSYFREMANVSFLFSQLFMGLLRPVTTTWFGANQNFVNIIVCTNNLMYIYLI